MKIQEVIDFVFKIAPNPEWADENIFEFGDGSGEVTDIGVAWWITSDIMLELGSRGYQLGLTHERTIYDLPPWYAWGQIPLAKELTANQNIERIAGFVKQQRSRLVNQGTGDEHTAGFPGGQF